MSRLGYVLTATTAAIGITLAAVLPTPTRLIWNASASVPVGLYVIAPDARPAVMDLVAVTPPEPLARFLAERHYLPLGVPLIKRVAAVDGQEVCRSGNAVSVDGVRLGDALARDRRDRPLPVWEGCRRVAPGQVFLMNTTVRDSLDGRYFGILASRAVIGRATPLYTDEAGDGRFQWRAPTR